MKELIEALKTSEEKMKVKQMELAEATSEMWKHKEELTKALNKAQNDSLGESDMLAGILKDGEHVYELNGQLLSIDWCGQDYKVLDVNLVSPLKLQP